MSGSHRRVIPREELSEFQRWQFNSLLDSPAAAAEALIPPTSINASDAGAVTAEPIQVQTLPPEEPIAVEEAAPLAEPAMPYPTAEEIEAIQQQAHDEGFQAGLEAGRLAAEAEVLQLQSLLASVVDNLKAAETELAESVLDLSLLVARQMICDELQSHPRQLLAPIREALDLLPTPTHPSRLYLSPGDMALLQTALRLELPDDIWRIVPDITMASGSCKIETPATQLSFSLASRWENILKVLKRNDSTDLAWGKYSDAKRDELTQDEPASVILPDSPTAENDAVD